MKKPIKPLTHILPMKNWDDKKQKWIGLVCQAVRYDDGSEGIVVLDVMSAKSEQTLNTELDLSMEIRPWLEDAKKLWGGTIQEPQHVEQ